MPAPYFHVVFTLPGLIADIAYQNKAVIYDMLSGPRLTPCSPSQPIPRRHLGASIGITAMLHTWGSAMTHHPHLHMIVPGGGLSLDGKKWLVCRPGFFLPVRVLSRLFRRLFLKKLKAAHAAGRLCFHGEQARSPSVKRLPPSCSDRKSEWTSMPTPVWRSRHRARLSVALHPPRRYRQSPPDRSQHQHRQLHYKDYRINGPARHKVMTLATTEFIRRFLMHVLPKGFHRFRLRPVRNALRADNIAHARQLSRYHKLTMKASAVMYQPRRSADQSLSMLRRPHDYHRDLRAWFPA